MLHHIDGPTLTNGGGLVLALLLLVVLACLWLIARDRADRRRWQKGGRR